MSVIVKGGGGKPEEEKTVTAGTSVIEVLPSSGKVMKKVTANPTPTETKEVSPDILDQTYNPPEGKHFSQFTVKAMPTGALSDITISSAGLITAQVGTEGYIAAGTKKTKQLTKQAAKTWIPTTADQSISAGVYTTGKQTINGDANLQAANIKKDVSLFGVNGSFLGMLETLYGVTKYAKNTFVGNGQDGNNVYIPHSLGEKPKVAFVIATGTVSNGILHGIIESTSFGSAHAGVYINSSSVYPEGSSNADADASQVRFPSFSPYVRGLTYELYTFA